MSLQTEWFGRRVSREGMDVMKLRTTAVAVVVWALACTALWGDAYTDAKANFDSLKKQVVQKENEVAKLRKENPACLLGPQTRSILNLEKKMPSREQKRYYFKHVTYVRPHFWCTKCKGEHDTSPCATSAKMSWPRWREHYEKIEATTKCNEQIDALMTELGDLQKQLADAKKERDAALEAMKKEKGSRAAK